MAKPLIAAHFGALLMNLDTKIKESIRFMLLPIAETDEGAAIDSVKEILPAVGIDEDAYSKFIELKFDNWRTDGVADQTLQTLIKTMLKSGTSDFSEQVSEEYLNLHSALVRNPFISFDLAIIVLSHLRLILRLAVEEQMSAAKILKLLRSIDHRLFPVPWRDIQKLLHILKIVPELDLNEVQSIYVEDERLETEYFADADIRDASYQVGEIARRLQFEGNAEHLLNTLSDPDKRHLPYLQILHYQCLISEFYDHVLSAPYEFSPRGTVANWVFAKWNDLLHTSNPILNNAKAVDILDENWARSRKQGEYEPATHLVTLLHGLDRMGFAAAQELTAWIRRWLIRYIKLTAIDLVPVPTDLNIEQISRIAQNVCSAPTQTFGILEQRITDVFASLAYPQANGWRNRGLGDAVNTNNVSRKKLGDCDFQNSTERKIVALEAHGGILKRIYVEGHLRTFRRALALRKEELEGVADVSDWNFNIIFVAYGFSSDLPDREIVDSNLINLTYLTFEELLADTDISTEPFSQSFNKFFLEVINSRRTPAFVRDKIRTLIES